MRGFNESDSEFDPRETYEPSPLCTPSQLKNFHQTTSSSHNTIRNEELILRAVLWGSEGALALQLTFTGDMAKSSLTEGLKASRVRSLPVQVPNSVNWTSSSQRYPYSLFLTLSTLHSTFQPLNALAGSERSERLAFHLAWTVYNGKCREAYLKDVRRKFMRLESFPRRAW